ncbi:hypothetical protein BV898_05409 [Hypsibius exemplaris]|uniref:Uncharacterized protein n=1 Tax=Hypsibius exemplaris TaxID=2072580 RepID=A0A1W0WZJ3_HYPEX|nr:hypothetical protein BV898_05409 [Hypsibius exemplaris]
MAFILMVKIVSLNPVLDCQVKWVKAVLEGKVSFPTAEQMWTETEREFAELGVQEQFEADRLERRAHALDYRMWPYLDRMIEEAALEPYEPVVKKMMTVSMKWLLEEITTYQQYRLERIDAENYVAEKLFTSSSGMLRALRAYSF